MSQAPCPPPTASATFATICRRVAKAICRSGDGGRGGVEQLKVLLVTKKEVWKGKKNLLILMHVLMHAVRKKDRVMTVTRQ